MMSGCPHSYRDVETGLLYTIRIRQAQADNFSNCPAAKTEG